MSIYLLNCMLNFLHSDEKIQIMISKQFPYIRYLHKICCVWQILEKF